MSAGNRVLYRDVKPFDVPTALDDLVGPSSGRVALPNHLCWAPGDGVYDLDEIGGAMVVYQSVITAGSADEQRDLLNKGLLEALWPDLRLDVGIIAAWEERFDPLRGRNLWGRIHGLSSAF